MEKLSSKGQKGPSEDDAGDDNDGNKEEHDKKLQEGSKILSTHSPSSSTCSNSSSGQIDPITSKYNIGKEIGRGSFATVYKATEKKKSSDIGSGKKIVALKSALTVKLSKKLLDTLESEISILKTLQHPHIVALIDCQRTPTHIHLIMEYCSLGDLSYFIKKRDKIHGNIAAVASMFDSFPCPPLGGLHEVIVRHFLLQLASALRFLRERNLIHRDLKPQNLLLCPPSKSIKDFQSKNYSGLLWNLPVLKIADFGFARFLPSTSMAETLCGSPLYMAPEILKFEKYDAKADLWSLGTVLYEMAVGKPPFRAVNHVELLRNIEKANDKIKFPSRISRDLIILIKALLKKNPADRITFQEFFANPLTNPPQISSRADNSIENDTSANTTNSKQDPTSSINLNQQSSTGKLSNENTNFNQKISSTQAPLTKPSSRPGVDSTNAIIPKTIPNNVEVDVGPGIPNVAPPNIDLSGLDDEKFITEYMDVAEDLKNQPVASIFRHNSNLLLHGKRRNIPSSNDPAILSSSSSSSSTSSLLSQPTDLHQNKEKDKYNASNSNSNISPVGIKPSKQNSNNHIRNSKSNLNFSSPNAHNSEFGIQPSTAPTNTGTRPVLSNFDHRRLTMPLEVTQARPKLVTLQRPSALERIQTALNAMPTAAFLQPSTTPADNGGSTPVISSFSSNNSPKHKSLYSQQQKQAGQNQIIRSPSFSKPPSGGLLLNSKKQNSLSGLSREHKLQLQLQLQNAANNLEDALLEKDYVMVEKRAVEVNAFADQLALAPRFSPNNNTNTTPLVPESSFSFTPAAASRLRRNPSSSSSISNASTPHARTDAMAVPGISKVTTSPGSAARYASSSPTNIQQSSFNSLYNNPSISNAPLRRNSRNSSSYGGSSSGSGGGFHGEGIGGAVPSNTGTVDSVGNEWRLPYGGSPTSALTRALSLAGARLFGRNTSSEHHRHHYHSHQRSSSYSNTPDNRAFGTGSNTEGKYWLGSSTQVIKPYPLNVDDSFYIDDNESPFAVGSMEEEALYSSIRTTILLIEDPAIKAHVVSSYADSKLASILPPIPSISSSPGLQQKQQQQQSTLASPLEDPLLIHGINGGLEIRKGPFVSGSKSFDSSSMNSNGDSNNNERHSTSGFSSSLEYTYICAQEALALYVKVLSLFAKAMRFATEWWNQNSQHIANMPNNSNIGSGTYISNGISRGTMRIHDDVQWIRDKFNRTLDKAEFIRMKIKDIETSACSIATVGGGIGSKGSSPLYSLSNSNYSNQNQMLLSPGAGNLSKADMIVVPDWIISGSKQNVNDILYERALEISRVSAVNELIGDDLKSCEQLYYVSMWMLAAILDDEGSSANNNNSSSKGYNAKVGTPASGKGFTNSDGDFACEDQEIDVLEEEDKVMIKDFISTIQRRSRALKKKLEGLS